MQCKTMHLLTTGSWRSRRGVIAQGTCVLEHRPAELSALDPAPTCASGGQRTHIGLPCLPFVLPGP